MQTNIRTYVYVPILFPLLVQNPNLILENVTDHLHLHESDTARFKVADAVDSNFTFDVNIAGILFNPESPLCILDIVCHADEESAMTNNSMDHGFDPTSTR